jgi:hypothetical protein
MSANTTSYLSQESEFLYGNKQQKCVVEMPLSKTTREQDKTDGLFTTYYVTLGARIYASDSDANFKQLPEQKFKFELKEPSYNTDA